METTKQVQKTGNRKLISGIFMLALAISSLHSMAGSETTKPLLAHAKTKATVVFANSCESNQHTLLAFATPATSGKQLAAKTTNSVVCEQIEQEKTLEIESWMLDSKNFGLTKSEDESNANEKLSIEPWMTSEKLWRF